MMPPRTGHGPRTKRCESRETPATSSTETATKPLSERESTEVDLFDGATVAPMRLRRRLSVYPVPRDAIGRRIGTLPRYFEHAVRIAGLRAQRSGVELLDQFDIAVASEGRMLDWALDGTLPARYEARPVIDLDGQLLRVFIVPATWARGK